MSVVEERVSFEVCGARVVGTLFLPGARRRAPGVVVAGPMTSVKEQVCGTYAASFAATGYAALAIDHRHYGESEGLPRQYEHAQRKIQDLVAAVGFLSARAEVDPARIATVGVCLGAGYAAGAAAEDARVTRLGFVVGYYRDPDAIRARDPQTFDARCAEGRSAREHYERSGEVRVIPAAALEGDAAMQSEDTVDYYTRRARVPGYVNAFAVMSREHFLPFDVQRLAEGLRAPVAMVHSEAALSPAWARSFFGRVTTPKTLDWLASRTHTQFYDDPELVRAATATIVARWRGWDETA